VRDLKICEQVAREFVDRHGPDALRILREHAEIADAVGDDLSAKAWRDIADVADHLLLSNEG
jgi:hypothetical protein